MTTPRRPILKLDDQCEDLQTITFHISQNDILELDLQFIADMLEATLTDQTASSLLGRVEFSLEEDALRLFERGLPTLPLRSYLRIFHYTVPTWPLLVSPENPWGHLMAIANAENVGCCYHSVTRRARYRVHSHSLNQFIESLRQGVETAARSLSIPATEWHPIMQRVTTHLRKLDWPTTPEK